MSRDSGRVVAIEPHAAFFCAGETMGGKDAEQPRRILDVDVAEVSLVDRAANLRKFLIVKRLNKEETEMGAFLQELDEYLQKRGANSEGFKELHADLAELAKGLPERDLGAFWALDLQRVAKAAPDEQAADADLLLSWASEVSKVDGAPQVEIAKVAAFVVDALGGSDPFPAKPVQKAEDVPSEDELKKALPAELADAIKRVMQFLGKVAGGKYPYPKPMAKGEGEGTAVEKALPAELSAAIKRVSAFLQKLGEGKYPYPKPEQKQDKKDDDTKTEPAKKSDDGNQAEQPAIQVFEDGTVVVKGQQVAKGKQFTADRTSTLKQITMQLVKLIGEVADEETKKSLGEAFKAIGAGSVLESSLSTPTQKSTEDKTSVENAELKKKLEETTAEMVEIKKQLDTILKTRSAGTPTDDEKAKAEELKKNQKGFWSGVV